MNLLLAVDDAAGAAMACDQVQTQCRREQTVIRVLHVDDWAKGLPVSLAFGEGPTAGDDLVAYRSARRQDAEALVAGVAADLAREGFQVTTSIVEGDARHGILHAAEAWPADLIVLGSHSRRGLARALLGSVSDAVSRHATCSVQIVRDRPQSKSV